MLLEDPSSFMADFGSPVIFESQTTLAIFEQPDSQILVGRVQSTGYSIEYPATKLVGLKNGSTVLIGITQGWGFDSTGRRLQFFGPCPERADSGQFQVIGVPAFLEDGMFMRAELERL